MFDFPNDQLIKSHREQQQFRLLGSFKSEDKNFQASLIKGLSVAEFDATYPDATFEKFSFEAVEKYKADLRKANESDLVKADTEIQQEIASLQQVVVQQGELKKIVLVRKKA